MKKFTFSRMLSAAALMTLSLAANAQYVKLTAIGGSKFNQSEGVEYLVDGKIGTKWGQSFDPNSSDPERNQCYAILKSETAIKPTSYFVVTGGDTGSFTDRNWEDWTIYGGNFADDKDAVKGAEGWEVIDQKSHETLPQANSKEMNFTMAEPDKAYTHFLIDVTQNVKHGDTWTQMDEFGFGTFKQFQDWAEEQAQDVTKPIEYTILAGDRNNGDGEGLKSLFDGNYGTKWGNGFTANQKGDVTNGAYFIIKTSRSVSPDYIKLVTGTDNESWHDRNWRDFDLYAIADVAEADIKRDHAGWVELKSWDNVGPDVLPDKNSFEVFIPFEKTNQNKYRYFKVEIHKIQSGSGYMQMSEFALGDEHMAKIDKQTMIDRALGSLDIEKKFQKSLLEQLNAQIGAVEAATDIAAAKVQANELDAIVANIRASINAYDEYIATLADVANHFNNHTCITGEGREVIGKYLNQNVAPDATFTNGSSVYVLENCLLDVEGIKAEAKYANSLLEMYASDLTDGFIDTDELEWTLLSSADGKTSGEFGGALFDHAYTSEDGTKWGFGGAGWGIFKCETSEINPTYYTLCVANDTDGSRGRQWKTWKIYGGNFANDEAATRDAEGWVLIDEKTDIADADFPTTNFSQTTFNMTNGGGSYRYFRIEVIKNRAGNTGIGSGDYTQMGELLFYNQANFRKDRNEKYEEMAGFLDEVEGVYYVGLKNEYNKTLAELKASSNGAEVGNAVSKLESLQKQIEESVELYEDYADKYEELEDFSDYENGTTAAWYEAYATTDVTEPCALLRNGSYGWIMEGNLENAKLSDEMEYIDNMNRANNEENTLVYLSGYVVNQWGDGHPKHLVDGITGQPGDNNPPSKLGGNIDASGRTHVIFKTLEQMNPFFYTLMTGGDTYTYQNRNWGAWDIYGANFAGDAEATEDSEGWILIDSKNGVTKQRLKPDNLTKSPFGFMVNGVETTTPYQYYKIVINSCFQDGKTEFVGGATQMQELTFGTEEEFEDIKNEWIEEANEYDYKNKLAYSALKAKYTSCVEDSIGGCTNMEVLYRIKEQLDLLKDSIDASELVYSYYNDKVEEAHNWIEQNEDKDAPSYAAINAYVNGESEPGEVFENGAALYILDNAQLPDSTITDVEMPRLKELMGAYAAEAYVAGCEITSMIKNPSFESFEGWEGDSLYTNGISTSKRITAAEWCVTNGGAFDAHQTLTNLKPGYYLVSMNAAFRANRNKYSRNSMAVVYANDATTLVPTIREELISEDLATFGVSSPDKPVYDGEKDPGEGEEAGVLGYAVWGTIGSANAFENGYFKNVLLTTVGQDGTLTFGVKNLGTANHMASGQDDWLAAGNTRVVYVGADVTPEALAEAKANVEAKAKILEAYEDSAVIEGAITNVDDMKLHPTYPLASYNAVKSLDLEAAYEAMANIPVEKEAYTNLFIDMDKIYTKYSDDHEAEWSAGEDFQEILDEITLPENRNMTAAQAANTAEAMYAKYPEYFGIKLQVVDEILTTKSAGMSVIENETEAFCYEITLEGQNPYAEFDGLYNAADSTRNYLLIEYTSTVDLNTTFYYLYPALGGEKDEFTMPTATSTKKLAIDLTPARNGDIKWGSAANHGFRLQFKETEGELTIGHIKLVTEAEIEGAEVITDIKNVENAVAPVMSGVYNIAGQRVSKATKGVFIINGNKVVIK